MLFGDRDETIDHGIRKCDKLEKKNLRVDMTEWER